MKQAKLQLSAKEKATFAKISAPWLVQTHSYLLMEHDVERIGTVESELKTFLAAYMRSRGLPKKTICAELYAFRNVLMHTDTIYASNYDTLMIPVRLLGHLSYYKPGEDKLECTSYLTFKTGEPGEAVVAFDESCPHAYHAEGDLLQLAVTVGVDSDALCDLLYVEK